MATVPRKSASVTGTKGTNQLGLRMGLGRPTTQPRQPAASAASSGFGIDMSQAPVQGFGCLIGGLAAPRAARLAGGSKVQPLPLATMPGTLGDHFSFAL